MKKLAITIMLLIANVCCADYAITNRSYTNLTGNYYLATGLSYTNVGGYWYAVYGGGGSPSVWQLPEYASTVLWYKFDEATNAQGKIVDSSSIGTNVGTKIDGGALAWYAPSNGLSAYYWANGANNSMYAGVKVASSTNTYSVWARPTEIGGYSYMMGLGSTGYDLILCQTIGGTKMSAYDGSAREFNAVASANLNVWKLYTFVHNNNGTMTLYINGTSNSTVTCNYASLNTSNRLWSAYDGGNTFRAQANNWIFWTNSLTSSQVLDIYTNTYQYHGWSNSLALSNPTLYSNTVLEILGEYNYPASTDPTTNQAHMTSYSGANAYDPAWRANGTNGWWEFDGANDYLHNGQSAFLNGSTSITSYLWFRFRSVPNGAFNALWAMRGSYFSGLGLDSAGANSNLVSWMNTESLESTNILSSNRWYFAAVTWKTNDTWSLYLDGVLLTNKTSTSANIYYIVNDFHYIGKDEAFNSYNGEIDDVTFIKGQKLTSNEVFSIYQSSTNRHPNP